jgi:LPXTG-site transpeptidase (sortase) family protein
MATAKLTAFLKQSKKHILQRPRFARSLVVGIGVLGVVCTFGGLVYLRGHAARLSFNYNPPDSNTIQRTNGAPATIAIPDLAIDVPVVESVIDKGIWQVSSSGASHLTTSSYPGQGGNIIIYGHNTTSIFARLAGIARGQRIIITNRQGYKNTYKVDTVVIVDPSDISVVLPTKEETLTVYTCTGFLDSKRLVAIAHPLIPALLK